MPHTDSVDRADFDRLMVPSYGPSGFIPVRGERARVWDRDGRELIDFADGIAVNALGYAHPALVRALVEQAGKLWHVSNIYTNEPALRLASKLVAVTFAERVLFANSGAEANEAAFKLARRHVPFNDISALEESVSANTCAVVLEPMQGESGVLPAERAYLERARRAWRAAGVRRGSDRHGLRRRAVRLSKSKISFAAS